MLHGSVAWAQDAAHHREARQILGKLVSFRSAQGQGQLPAMAQYIEQTLRAGGVAPGDIVSIPHEDTVALIVRVKGLDAAARPLLFSSHMDVVDARPEDWQRSPFTLLEESGMFYGRGTIDNKTGVASLMSTILRLHASKQQPRRTLVFAFIGDEETGMETTRLVVARAIGHGCNRDQHVDHQRPHLSEQARADDLASWRARAAAPAFRESLGREISARFAGESVAFEQDALRHAAEKLHLEAERSALAAQVAAIRNSTSWCVTWPLRQIRHAVARTGAPKRSVSTNS